MYTSFLLNTLTTIGVDRHLVRNVCQVMALICPRSVYILKSNPTCQVLCWNWIYLFDVSTFKFSSFLGTVVHCVSFHLWSVPSDGWFPKTSCHALWTRCWVGLCHSHCENRRTEARNLPLWIHSPTLHFGIIPLFSWGCAAVHEGAST